MEFFSASDAQKLTNDSVSGPAIEPLLNNAFEKIKTAASKGERSITYPFHGVRCTPNQEAAALQKLRELGYKCSYYEGDYRDQRDLPYWSVSW